MRKELSILEKIPSWNKFYVGKHWMERKRLADYWHTQVMWYCRTEKVPHFESAWITVESHSKRPLDADNVCAKIIIDGLVMAGVLDDDSPKYLKGVTTISRKSSEELTKIIIDTKPINYGNQTEGH